MGQVDVAAVQRHLAAVGHPLSAPAVASLLADLGFGVGGEGDVSSSYGVSVAAAAQFGEKEARFEAKAPPPRRAAAAAPSQPAVARLLAKLEELERQLAAVSISQDRLEGAWEAGGGAEDEAEGGKGVPSPPQRWGSKGVPSPPQRHALGSEAQQLRDWGQGRWPAVAAPPPDGDRARRRRGPRPPSRRTDPVARHRQLQRAWAADPFLRSGGDCRASRRREEGFRDAFTALHSGGARAPCALCPAASLR